LDGLVAKGDMKIIGALGKNPRHNGAAIPSLSGISPEVHANGYYALIVPSETPKGVVDKIHRDVSGIVSTPEFRQTMTALGAFVEPPSKSGEFDRWIDREIDRLKKIIVQANIKIE
jgi:tripartite-type tricarboxylate transporter receptor subunit TctC